MFLKSDSMPKTQRYSDLIFSLKTFEKEVKSTVKLEGKNELDELWKLSARIEAIKSIKRKKSKLGRK